jgi:hypothetical protein
MPRRSTARRARSRYRAPLRTFRAAKLHLRDAKLRALRSSGHDR